ncbi:MAG: hypothetical protein PVG39_25900 [Desulfobacteraceae bacterium]|jgi:hypothetical protein
MRVIFNLHSHVAAAAAGWRAKEIRFDGSEIILEDMLKAVGFTDEETAYSFIFENSLVKTHFRLFVNGRMVLGPELLKIALKDNTQIHLMDKR